MLVQENTTSDEALNHEFYVYENKKVKLMQKVNLMLIRITQTTPY